MESSEIRSSILRSESVGESGLWSGLWSGLCGGLPNRFELQSLVQEVNDNLQLCKDW